MWILLDREENIASGQDSLVAFEKYLESGHEDILQEIIKYNQQDCKSLIYLQEWLIKIKPKNIKSSENHEPKEISESAIEQQKQENEVDAKISEIKNENDQIRNILRELNFYNR